MEIKLPGLEAPALVARSPPLPLFTERFVAEPAILVRGLFHSENPTPLGRFIATLVSEQALLHNDSERPAVRGMVRAG